MAHRLIVSDDHVDIDTVKHPPFHIADIDIDISYEIYHLDIDSVKHPPFQIPDIDIDSF